MLGFDLPTAEALPVLGPAGPEGLLVGTSPVPEGQRLEDVFTLQWCHVLAHVLHDRTGWPVVVVGDGRTGWVHAGVRMPDGHILDVTGRHSPADWLDDWFVAMDDFGHEYRDQCDGFYDPADVGIYEWQEVEGDVTTVGESPPAYVLEAAELTSDSLLRDLGWHAAGSRSPEAEPK